MLHLAVAEESPRGDGSLSMLERLLAYWPSKILVLTLLGFVATGLIITITSRPQTPRRTWSNPFLKASLGGKEVLVTLCLLLALAAIFLKGFKEAIGIAVVLVVGYLTLSGIVIGNGMWEVVHHPTW